MKILSVENTAYYIAQLDKVGLLVTLIPEIKKQKITAQDFYGKEGVWTHTLSGLAHLDELLPKLKKYFPRYFLLLRKHLEQPLFDTITRTTILKLAFVLHDFGKAHTHTKEGKRSRFFGHELAGTKQAEKILQRLHFSNKEIHIAKNIILNHMRPGNLSSLDEITDKAIYRYFRDLGEEVILSLADAFTTADTVITRKKQDIYPVDPRAHLRKVREIIARFYTHKKQIVPKNILNGSEIMTYFRLPEGPRIGELIEMLKEVQAQKLIWTKKEAYLFLSGHEKKI